MISAIESQAPGSSPDLVQQVAQIFSSNGLLSRSPNFEFRPQQQQMAVAVARALESKEHLAVEAGTGVGPKCPCQVLGREVHLQADRRCADCFWAGERVEAHR